MKTHVVLNLIYSSLIVGTKTGYRLYSLNSVDKLENIYESGKLKLLEKIYIIVSDKEFLRPF